MILSVEQILAGVIYSHAIKHKDKTSKELRIYKHDFYLVVDDKGKCVLFSKDTTNPSNLIQQRDDLEINLVLEGLITKKSNSKAAGEK